jgi:hypothetical protein
MAIKKDTVAHLLRDHTFMLPTHHPRRSAPWTVFRARAPHLGANHSFAHFIWAIEEKRAKHRDDVSDREQQDCKRIRRTMNNDSLRRKEFTTGEK